jgi:hypothetical protein
MGGRDVSQRITTDFTAGELSRKLDGRADLPLYYKGCSKIENFIPFSQGGITYRSGTKYLGRTKSDLKARLIPFVLSESLSFLLELGNNYMRFWQSGGLVKSGGVPIEVATPYLTAEIPDIQYAQVENAIYFAHRSHPVMVLSWTGGVSFTFSELSVTGNAGEIPFASETNYPGCIAFFHSRLFLASTVSQPQTIWASKPFEYGNFTYFDTISVTSKQLKDPTTWADPQVPEYEDVTTTRDVTAEDHAIEITIASEQNDRIQWMATGHDLVIGTTCSEWVINPDISALSQAARLQSRYGGAPIQGKMLSESVLFIQGSKKKLREYFYVSDQAAYQSPDLTFLSDHMLSSGVVDFDYTQTPEPAVYCTLQDGTISVLLYNKTHGTLAWYRFVTDGLVESVAVVTSGGDDAVYLVVKRNTVRCIEEMKPMFSDYYVDSGIQITKAGASASGLSHLEGKTVAIVTEDEASEAVVESGAVALPASIAMGEEVTIGLPYTGVMTSMRYTPPARIKRISEVTLRVLDSYPFGVGPDEDTLETARFTGPFSGEIPVPIRGDWTREAFVTVVQRSPRPVTILCLVAEVES